MSRARRTGPLPAPLFDQLAQADRGFTDEIEPRYPDFTVPTLIVWGTADDWIPVDRAHRPNELIPGSHLELIESAGHLVQEDRPAQLNAVLRR